MTDAAAQPAETANPTCSSHFRLLQWVTLIIVFLGVVSRFKDWEKVERHLFDEQFYKMYAGFHAKHSLADFAKYCDGFIKLQKSEPVGIPPPTRLAYPYAGAVLSNLTDMEIPHALTTISAMASAMMLVIAAIWAWRMFTPGIATMVTALMAVSLNQLHLSQRIMIDPVIGVLTIAALWALWEMGNKPENQRLFIFIYIISLAILVMVKENSAFIFLGIAALLATRRFTKVLPNLPPNLLLITVLAGGFSFVVLVFLTGGLGKFIDMYKLLVERSLATPYVHEFGDGPWYHYIVDSMIAQPIPTFLAIAALFWLPFQNQSVRYLTVFSLLTFAIMSQVKYAVFYRYAIIWDFSVAVLAAFQLRNLAERLPSRASLAQAAAVAIICATQIFSFWKIGIEAKGYALTTYDLMRAMRFYNPPPKPKEQTLSPELVQKFLSQQKQSQQGEPSAMKPQAQTPQPQAPQPEVQKPPGANPG